MTTYKQIPEYHAVSPEQFFNDLAPAQQPIVIRGFAQHWPLVVAAKQSSQDFVAYLNRFYSGKKSSVALAHPDAKGRFFYTDDLRGLNFIRGDERLDLFLERLLELAGKKVYPAVSIQNIQPSEIFPGLTESNRSDFFPDLEPRLWLGNQATVNTHYDGSDNLACVIAGRRNFTLFAPDQADNLYPGPLDFTPAGAPVSLVDLHQPDLQRYPRFKTALDNAYQAQLLPGDAIFIPMLWWHNVDSLESVNGLMNYWWNGSAVKGAATPTPLDSLTMAILALQGLTPLQRNAWRALFDHYVFHQSVNPASYIPPHCQRILGELSPEYKRQLKDYLIERLKQ